MTAHRIPRVIPPALAAILLCAVPTHLAGRSDALAQTASVSVPPADSPTGITTLHVTTRLVVLDVVVTDGGGHSVKGLKQSDFTLTEDGVPQTVLSITEHDASDNPPSAPTILQAPLPPNTFAVQPAIAPETPKTIIVLGDPGAADPRADLPPFPMAGSANSPFVRAQIADYLKSTAPATPVAIVRLDWQGLHLVQSLTTNRQTLLDAATSNRMLPPLGFPTQFLHRVGSPLQQLAGYLAAIPGRINLVWFIGGGDMPGASHEQSESLFPNLEGGISAQLNGFASTLNGGPNVLRLSRIALYPILASGITAPEPCSTQACVASVAESSVLAGSSCSSLREMAAKNGGKGYCNTNDFKGAVADAIATGSHFYTISYRPTNTNWNGAYRTIKVSVPSDESTSDKVQDWFDFKHRVSHREGYFAREQSEAAPTPPAVATTGKATATPKPDQRKLISYSPKGMPASGGHTRTPIDAALAFASVAPADIHFRVTVTPSSATHQNPPGAAMPKGNFLAADFRTQPYRNILLHYAIDPKDLSFTDLGALHGDELEFVAVLYRDDGGTVNSFSRTVPITVDDDGFARLMSAPVALDQTIAIPVTGNFYLRTAVHELPTNHIGALDLPSELIQLPAAPPKK